MNDLDKLYKKKIIKIECILIIPIKIQNDIKNIYNKYKNLSKSIKILKKPKYRLKTNDFIKKLKLNDLLGNMIEPNHKNFIIFLNSFSNNNFFADFRDIYKNDKTFDKDIFTYYIIDLINSILLKYIKILIHVDDQIYIKPKKNKDGNKIFLKFFLPKIFINPNNINSIEHFGIKHLDGNINKNGDNIHVTILPAISGHLFDGIIHLTFRIEGKGNMIFEYSKYLSLNRESNKFAFILYNDISLSDYIIFRFTSDLENIIYLMRFGLYNKIIEIFTQSKEFNNLCEFIGLDIFNQMIINKSIDIFLTKYHCGIGTNIFSNIIGILLKIIFFSFIDLSFI